MAYSDDTQAIIDRLKAEGDLIRNTGTNSVRSLNLKLEKFDGLFQSINANVIEQTSMMQAQMGYAVDAQERARTKEQFEEIAQKEDIADKKETKDKKPLSEVGNKAGDALAKGFNKIFTLKNLAAMGAIGFVGANFLKGFVEEYGGFSNILKDMGVSDESISDLENIGPSIKEMKKDFDAFIGPDGPLTSMKTNLADLNTNLASLNTTFENIKNMNWETIANIAFVALPIFGLSIKLAGMAVAGVTLRWKQMAADLDKGMKPDPKGRPWYYKFFAPTSPEVPTTTPNYPPGEAPDDGSRGGQKPNPSVGKPEGGKPKGGANAGPPGTNSTVGGFDKGAVRNDAVKAGNQFKFDKNNRLQNTGGGFASDADALNYLKKVMPEKYSKMFKGLLKGAGILAVVISVYDAYRIYNILNNTDGTYKTDEQKAAGIGPIIGPLFTGFAAGAIGSAFGFMVGGPWGALGGGIVFGLAGSFASPEVFGIMLAKALLKLNPDKNDIEILTGMSVRPRPTGTGRNARGKQTNWDGKYKGKFDPITGMALTSKPLNMVPSTAPAENQAEAIRRQEMREMDLQIEENQKIIDETNEKYNLSKMGLEGTAGKQRMAEMVLAGGGGNAVNVFNSTNNSPHFFNTHHGNHAVTTTRVAVGDGGGTGGGNLSKYGITGFA